MNVVWLIEGRPYHRAAKTVNLKFGPNFEFLGEE
jgi:hypothetical protein